MRQNGLSNKLFFELNDRSFCIGLNNIIEVIAAISSVNLPTKKPFCNGVIQYGSDLIPLLSLSSILGFGQTPIKSSDHFIVANIHDKKFALHINRVEGVKAVEERELAKAKKLSDNTEEPYLLLLKNNVICLLELESIVSRETLIDLEKLLKKVSLE